MGILYITVFVFITMIASFSLSQVYALPIIYDDDYMVEKFVTGLEYPTTMIFVGNDMLVLEKNTGKVIRIQDNGVNIANLFWMCQLFLTEEKVYLELLLHPIIFIYILPSPHRVLMNTIMKT